MIKKNKQAGFTLIELMIATVVFSIVLLVISASIIQIGRLYFKGLTAARTQSTARSVMDSITQSLQFSTSGNVSVRPIDPADPTQKLCAGGQSYVYKLGQQRKGSQYGLLNEAVGGSCDVSNLTLSGDETELLGEDMRVANIQVTPQVDGRYSVLVRIVYGDDDLLCSPTLAPDDTGANCSNGTTEMNATNIPKARDLTCKNIRSGSQFCAVSELSTTVERRL